jgi:hypothetical protein
MAKTKNKGVPQYASADTGVIVSKDYAVKHPKTTYKRFVKR